MPLKRMLVKVIGAKRRLPFFDFPHTLFTSQLDADSVVDQPIEDRIGDSRIREASMPGRDWILCNEHARSAAIARIEQIEKDARISDRQLIKEPLIEDKALDLVEAVNRLEEPFPLNVAGKVGEQLMGSVEPH